MSVIWHPIWRISGATIVLRRDLDEDLPSMRQSTLLAHRGFRALAHTRVDERAGLPKGSTSNYFRTDQALLSGIVDTLEELDTLAAGAAFPLASGEEVVEAICRLFDYMTRVNRITTTARLVLSSGQSPLLA